MTWVLLGFKKGNDMIIFISVVNLWKGNRSRREKLVRRPLQESGQEMVVLWIRIAATQVVRSNHIQDIF